MASGGGRFLVSSDPPRLDVVEPMLEVDKFRLCPRLGGPLLPVVDARERFVGGRTRSVRIWR